MSDVFARRIPGCHLATVVVTLAVGSGFGLTLLQRPTCSNGEWRFRRQRIDAHTGH